jgi:hypothetical protein
MPVGGRGGRPRALAYTKSRSAQHRQSPWRVSFARLSGGVPEFASGLILTQAAARRLVATE